VVRQFSCSLAFSCQTDRDGHGCGPVSRLACRGVSRLQHAALRGGHPRLRLAHRLLADELHPNVGTARRAHPSAVRPTSPSRPLSPRGAGFRDGVKSASIKNPLVPPRHPFGRGCGDFPPRSPGRSAPRTRTRRHQSAGFFADGKAGTRRLLLFMPIDANLARRSEPPESIALLAKMVFWVVPADRSFRPKIVFGYVLHPPPCITVLRNLCRPVRSTRSFSTGELRSPVSQYLADCRPGQWPQNVAARPFGRAASLENGEAGFDSTSYPTLNDFLASNRSKIHALRQTIGLRARRPPTRM